MTVKPETPRLTILFDNDKPLTRYLWTECLDKIYVYLCALGPDDLDGYKWECHKARLLNTYRQYVPMLSDDKKTWEQNIEHSSELTNEIRHVITVIVPIKKGRKEILAYKPVMGTIINPGVIREGNKIRFVMEEKDLDYERIQRRFNAQFEWVEKRLSECFAHCEEWNNNILERQIDLMYVGIKEVWDKRRNFPTLF